MKVSDTPKGAAASVVQDRRRTQASSAAPASVPVDETILAGIPEKELTPRVRETLMSLMGEVQQLRAELAAAKSRLNEVEKLADRDPLLDVLNRRAFVRELDRTLAMMDRYGVTASLIFVDLNDLKIINDKKGHLAGDAALAHVASVLSSNIRQTDVVGRLGGDEFGVLLTQADHATASNKAAELAETVQREGIQWKGEPLTPSISCGVVEIKKGLSVDEAMEQADFAMYDAKRHK